MFKYQEKIAAVAAVILVVLCMHLPSSDAKLEKRSCRAKWNLLAHYNSTLNSTSQNKSYSYQVGLHSSQDSHRPYGEMEPETIVTIEIQFSNHHSSVDVVEMSDASLTGVTDKTKNITVEPWELVNIWQFIVESGCQVFGFDNITVSDTEPQAEVSSCLATYNVRELIQSDSPVRLKHESTGMYMVVTSRKGWDAATLGHSQSYYFRFTNLGYGVTRITTYNSSYPGYSYLYSSTLGGIYFDVYDESSDKQEWRLSSRLNPRDGDAVTIRSERWPEAYITYFNEYSPSVYCDYTRDPDRWIIELVK